MHNDSNSDSDNSSASDGNSNSSRSSVGRSVGQSVRQAISQSERKTELAVRGRDCDVPRLGPGCSSHGQRQGIRRLGEWIVLGRSSSWISLSPVCAFRPAAVRVCLKRYNRSLGGAAVSARSTVCVRGLAWDGMGRIVSS